VWAFVTSSLVSQVLCRVDTADGNHSFDLVEVASQSQAQMTSILQTVSERLNHLDKQLKAEEQDAALGAVLKVAPSIPLVSGSVENLVWRQWRTTNVNVG
jgi:hypothetical protein